MGRKVSFVLDSKDAIHVDREALPDVHDESAFAENERSSISSRKLSLSPFKDAVKLALFCALTVAGMTLISQVFPRYSWSNVRFSALHNPSFLPI